ncbi:MAG: peptide chain release factor 3, partial [Bdellovibrionales bacterium]|nr:peptide chain release factor 3 [Bdellovibrionales bacterium]
PILTFINKMDLPGREALDLLSEVEEVLGIHSSPMNWPIGEGKSFRGVYDRVTNEVILFDKSEDGGSKKALAERIGLDQAVVANKISAEQGERLKEDIELLDEAGNAFSRDLFLSGELTPVFFGSALTNFGVEPFFDSFASLAPSPVPREAIAADGSSILILPEEDPFSAYVFKIQANMDPRHRDSMAYLRICSGVFERDLLVKHHRSGKEIRLSRSHSMFGGERSTLDEAYAGDIVGVVNPGVFAIGDTVSIKGGFDFLPMPKFPPEVVARIRPKDVMRRKSFDKGMKQFRDEGAVLILEAPNHSSEPLVAAVGVLQFEVLQHRLQSEYRVETILETLPYRHGAWLFGDVKSFQTPSSSMIAYDAGGQPIFLYTQDWERQFALEKNPAHTLKDFIQ